MHYIASVYSFSHFIRFSDYNVIVCFYALYIVPRREVNMSKSLPRWLFLLIGLVILVVVSAVVFRSINAMNSVAVKTTVSPHSTSTSSRSYSIKAVSDQHVFLIVMENHNWSDIKNSPSAPYINNTLLPTASYAEQYYNPPGNHPSEPNYLWLEAGTNFGISNDLDPVFNHQSTTQHFVTLLSNAGLLLEIVSRRH